MSDNSTSVTVDYSWNADTRRYKYNASPRIICSSDGSIEKIFGDGAGQILIPGDVMEEAVRIALDKINNKLEEK